MEPRKRIHLINELMQETNLMMSALEKAMQGERFEETHSTLHGMQHDRPEVGQTRRRWRL